MFLVKWHTLAAVVVVVTLAGCSAAVAPVVEDQNMGNDESREPVVEVEVEPPTEAMASQGQEALIEALEKRMMEESWP